ncbi:MAG: PAS domain-containing sensor histidine kinase, partial [Saprospiraceae bacterium]
MSTRSLFAQQHPLRILQSVVETAIDGIFLMNNEGIIILCNPAGNKLFGYEPNELIGKDITLLMPSPHRQQHATYVNNYLTTGIRKIIGIGREIDGLRKDGSLFPARLAVSEIIMDEEHFFTGIIHDLSEVKAAEKKLLLLNQELEQMVADRTNELQDAINRLLDTNQLLIQSIEKHKTYENALLEARDELRKSLENEKDLGKLKSGFISMASHEFKTPLSSIISSAALIGRYESSEHITDRQRHIERIKTSVSHLNLILSDFLSIGKLDEGRVEVQVTSFSLNEMIDDLIIEMKDLLKKGQHLSFDYRTAGIELKSDKNMIRNILYNLLSNASKYSGEDQPIRGIVKRNENNIIIEITDHGIGIPIEDTKHIGSRFFRS